MAKGRVARGGAHAKTARHQLARARSRHGDNSTLARRVRGCSTELEDFLKQMAGSAERLDVDRPLRDVGATFRERAAACMNVTTKRYGGPAVRYTMQVWTHTATVVATGSSYMCGLSTRVSRSMIKGRTVPTYSWRMRPRLVCDEPIWSSGPTLRGAMLFATP